MSTTAYLLAQGDELLTGQTVDTNSAWLAERLHELGVTVLEVRTVGDDPAAITAAIDHACRQADLVIGTGGLGPTSDDHTNASAAAALGEDLVLFDDELAHIAALFARFGRPMSKANEKQAWLPASAKALRNNWGTAPGFAIELHGALACFVPGVPREMRALWKHAIVPLLADRVSAPSRTRLLFRCMGIAESVLEERTAPLAREGWTVGFRTKLPENQVKVYVDAGHDVVAARDEVLAVLGKSCFGVDCGDLEEVIGELLVAAGQTVATAESCTGGQISAALTRISGSSRYFLEGACLYANEAKIRGADVDPDILAAHGAVSEPVARQLAESIRARAGASWGLGTTGIAGPGGGTADKPVGTVHIALAGPEGTWHRRLRLGGGRERITRLATGAALDMLRRALQGVLGPPS